MRPQKNGNGNKPKIVGIVNIVGWALFLALIFNSCTAMFSDANSVQVDYSTFRTWVEEDKVEYVHMGPTRYTITLKEGVTVDLGEENEKENTLISILGKEGIENGLHIVRIAVGFHISGAAKHSRDLE